MRSGYSVWSMKVGRWALNCAGYLFVQRAADKGSVGGAGKGLAIILSAQVGDALLTRASRMATRKMVVQRFFNRHPA